MINETISTSNNRLNMSFDEWDEITNENEESMDKEVS